MAASIPTTLRRPNRPGFMAPFMVLEMANAIERVMGAENLDLALKEAQLFRLPKPNEPVREDKAARLHQAVRKLWAPQADEISGMAGAASAERIMETQISARAKMMLAKMPRTTGAWLLAKTARQNSWAFSGAGEFVVESEKRFVLKANPIVAGETANTMVCQFHAKLLEKLFSTLIHPRLKCTEIACHAAGAKECVFEFTLGPKPADADATD